MAYSYITRYDSPNYTPHARVPAAYGGPREIRSITIHHWGIRGQDFYNVVRYLCRRNGNTSAHEVIEAGKVAVIVNHRDVAWHSGNTTGNRTSIGLELRPEATDGDYLTAAERIADLRRVYGNIPLRRHSDWKATACPGKWDLARLDRLATASLAGHPIGGTGTVPTAPDLTLPDPLEEDMPTPEQIAAAVKAVIPNPWGYMFGRGDSRVSAGQMLAEARRDAAASLAVVREIAARPADAAQIDPDELEQIITRAAERIEIDVTVTDPE